MEFFLPLKEFLPQNSNSCMSINSGPCASIKELIKTTNIGCIKNADIIDIAFIFSPVFLENVTHAVAAGMENVFICWYVYKDRNRVHDEYACICILHVLDLFDDPFPKHVWDGIIVVQEQCWSLLSTYSAKQGDYFHSTKKVNFPADVWMYLSAICFDRHARQQLITKTSTICQRLDDGVIVKSVHVIRPAIQYLFQTEHELYAFHSIFGRTTTFGKCSCCLMVIPSICNTLISSMLLFHPHQKQLKLGKGMVLFSILMVNILPLKCIITSTCTGYKLDTMPMSCLECSNCI